MRTRLGIVSVIVGWVAAAACGGSQPAPAPVAKTPPVAALPPPAPVSCEDASAILLPGGLGNDQVRERSARIAATCKADKWSQKVLTCIGSSHTPGACLDDLTKAQQLTFEEVAGGPADEDEEPPDTHVAENVLDCNAVALRPLTYPPARGAGEPEEAWDTSVRRRAIAEACEDNAWANTLRVCLAAADTDKANGACLDALDVAERDELTKKLTEVDALAGAIAKAKKKPAAIGCKQVVAAHYGDAKWKTKLDGFKPGERKKMISESRTKMQTACASAPWDDTLRACIVAGGNETCFQSYSMGLAWGYPAAGVKVALGIPECDDYAAALAKIVACDKLPQASRDALQQSSEELFAQVLARPQKERATFASTCKAGADAIQQSLTAIGC